MLIPEASWTRGFGKAVQMWSTATNRNDSSSSGESLPTEPSGVRPNKPPLSGWYFKDNLRYKFSIFSCDCQSGWHEVSKPSSLGDVRALGISSDSSVTSTNSSRSSSIVLSRYSPWRSPPAKTSEMEGCVKPHSLRRTEVTDVADHAPEASLSQNSAYYKDRLRIINAPRLYCHQEALRPEELNQEEPTLDHPNSSLIEDKQLRNLFITSVYSDRWYGPLDLKEKNDQPVATCAQYTLTESARLRIGSHDFCLVSYLVSRPSVICGHCEREIGWGEGALCTECHEPFHLWCLWGCMHAPNFCSLTFCALCAFTHSCRPGAA